MPKTLDRSIIRIPVDAQAIAEANHASFRREALEICIGLAVGIALCALIILAL